VTLNTNAVYSLLFNKLNAMRQKKKAQEILVYATLIAVIAGVLVLMSGYISRRIMGVYQSAGDGIGGGEIQD